MPLDPGPLPLYHQLEENLRARIHAGEFEPGAALPSEERICAEYGVSRITVRRALEALHTQGLIVRRRGVGSFVAESRQNVRSIRLVGSLDEFLAGAGALRTRFVSLETVVAPPRVIELLALEPGSEATEMRAVSELDGAPIGYLEIYVPPAAGRLISQDDLTNELPVIRVVERKLNTRVARAEQVIEPDRAGPDAARHLGIGESEPILRVTRVYYTAFDQPIEAAFVRYHPNRYRYAIDFRAGRV